MRIVEALLLIAAALALWFAVFDFLLTSAPQPQLRYVSFNVGQYWYVWLIILAATIAGYVATRRR
ncbi:MAG: hypothetical protein QXI07_09630 [Pyrobaculum sp.]